VNAPPYSSLTAFRAHLRALRALPAPSEDQSARLAEMEALVGELPQDDRNALEAGDSAGPSGRHRQRAERHLSQILRDRGVLAG
jgi:predicted DNA-binding transcriptional regulator YafY